MIRARSQKGKPPLVQNLSIDQKARVPANDSCANEAYTLDAALNGLYSGKVGILRLNDCLSFLTNTEMDAFIHFSSFNIIPAYKLSLQSLVILK